MEVNPIEVTYHDNKMMDNQEQWICGAELRSEQSGKHTLSITSQ